MRYYCQPAGQFCTLSYTTKFSILVAGGPPRSYCHRFIAFALLHLRRSLGYWLMSFVQSQLGVVLGLACQIDSCYTKCARPVYFGITRY